MDESLLCPTIAPMTTTAAAPATSEAAAHAQHEAQDLLLLGVERVVEIAQGGQHARRAGLQRLKALRDPGAGGLAIKALAFHKASQVLHKIRALDSRALDLHGFEQRHELGLLRFVEVEAAGNAISDVLDARSVVAFVGVMIMMVMAAVVVKAGQTVEESHGVSFRVEHGLILPRR